MLVLNFLWFCFSSFMLSRGGRRAWAYAIDIVFLIVISTGVVLCHQRSLAGSSGC